MQRRRLCTARTLSLAALLALLTDCSAPNRDDAAFAWFGNGRLAEVGGPRVAGIDVGTFEDLTSLNLSRAASTGAFRYRQRYDDDPPSLELSDIQVGEIAAMRIELARFPDPEWSGPDAEWARKRTPVVCVSVEPRWPEHVGATPAEQAAYLGVELGELVQLSLTDGALFATSNPRLFVALAKQASGVSIVRVLSADLSPEVETGSTLGASGLGQASAEQLQRFAKPLADAAAAGSEAATRAHAVASASGSGRVRIEIEQRRGEYAAGDSLGRFCLLIELDERLPSGVGDTPEGAQFATWCDELRAQLDREAVAAQAGGLTFEAAGWWCLVDLLDDLRTRGSAGMTKGNARDLLLTLRELDGASLERCIEQHGIWQRALADSESRVATLRAGALRNRLIPKLLEHAKSAEGRRLPATACFHYALAHAVRQGRAADSTPKQTVFSALWDATRQDDPLTQARGLAARLAMRVLPVFDPDDAAAAPLVEFYERGRVLKGSPFLSRLALTMGTRHELLSSANAAPHGVLSVEFGEPHITLELDERHEIATRTFFDEQVVANTDALTEWERQMSHLAWQIKWATEAIVDARAASSRVTGTHGFVDREYAYSDDKFVYYRETRNVETLASIQARIDAVGQVEKNQKLLAELGPQYERLAAQRPPDTRLETTSWVVRFPRDVQRWKVKVERDVTFVGKDLRHTTPCEKSFELEYERVFRQSANGIPDVDEFRTEEQVRADEALRDGSNPEYVLATASDFFETRLRELEQELDATHDATDAEEEKRYLRWLLRSPARLEDPGEIAELERLGALAGEAAAGFGGELPTAIVSEDYAGVDDTSDPEVLRAGGAKAFANQDFVAAARLFERVRQANPREEAIHYDLAWAWIYAHRYEEAVETYTRLCDLSPTRMHRALLAGSLALAGRIEDAQAKLSPMHGEASREEWDAYLEHYQALVPLADRPGFVETLIGHVRWLRDR